MTRIIQRQKKSSNREDQVLRKGRAMSRVPPELPISVVSDFFIAGTNTTTRERKSNGQSNVHDKRSNRNFGVRPPQDSKGSAQRSSGCQGEGPTAVADQDHPRCVGQAARCR